MPIISDRQDLDVWSDIPIIDPRVPVPSHAELEPCRNPGISPIGFPISRIDVPGIMRPGAGILLDMHKSPAVAYWPTNPYAAPRFSLHPTGIQPK